MGNSKDYRVVKTEDKVQLAFIMIAILVVTLLTLMDIFF
jgi:hypothetical protein